MGGRLGVVMAGLMWVGVARADDGTAPVSTTVTVVVRNERGHGVEGVEVDLLRDGEPWCFAGKVPSFPRGRELTDRERHLCYLRSEGRVCTDDLGRAVFPRPTLPGSWTVRAQSATHTEARQPFVPATATRLEVRVTRLATLELTLEGAEPVGTVFLLGTGGSYGGGPTTNVPQERRVPPGRYALEVVTDDGRCSRREVEVGPGETRKVHFVLGDGTVVVRGVVRDPTGRPLAGVPVAPKGWPMVRWDDEARWRGAVTTAADGSFELRLGVLPEELCVGDWRTFEQVTVKPTAGERLEVVLTPRR